MRWSPPPPNLVARVEQLRKRIIFPIDDAPSPSRRATRSHGYCKRSEAKAWIRHGRVTFEGDVVKTCDAKVVVRLYDGVCVDGKPVPLTKKESSAKENDENDAPSAE